MSSFSPTSTPKSFLAGLLSIPSSPNLGVAPTHVQDPALGLIEPYEVHMGPFLELVQVPLDRILQHVNHTTQLGVICKLPEGSLDHSILLMKILNCTGPNMDP